MIASLQDTSQINMNIYFITMFMGVCCYLSDVFFFCLISIINFKHGVSTDVRCGFYLRLTVGWVGRDRTQNRPNWMLLFDFVRLREFHVRICRRFIACKPRLPHY